MLSLLQNQIKLNDQMFPDWRDSLTISDFALAASQECSELIDHTDWKWWSSKEVSMKQIHLEAVDIFHFILSIMLCNKRSNQWLGVFYDSMINGHSPEEGPLEVTVKLQKALLKDPALIDHDHDEYIHDVVSAYSLLVRHLNLDIETLKKLYFAKNILNQFRQDNGYANKGEYRKIWNGREDNEVMYDIVTSAYYQFINLYQRLQEAYHGTK